MSGVYPTTPIPDKVSLGSYTPILKNRSHSGRRNVRLQGAHQWYLTFSYPNTLSRDQFMPIWAFIMSQKGEFDTFQVVSPELVVPRGTPLGTPVVSAASQVGNSLQTSGWDPNITVFKAGDIFKLSGHTKVYMITSDILSDNLGNAVLNFEPALLRSPAVNESLIVTDVPFTMSLNSNRFSYDVNVPMHFSHSVSMIEAI